MTADALKTITSPIKTSSMVTVNSHRSTLTRLAMGNSFHHGGNWEAVHLSFDADCFGSESLD